MIVGATAGDDRLDLVFQALANRTRRALLQRLTGGAARVTDLASPFDMSLAAISRHLAVLERAGLIERSINGRVHSCALDVGAMAPAEEWLAAYREFWNGKLDRLAEFAEEAAMGKESP